MFLMVYIHNYRLELTFCASFKSILDMNACMGMNLRLSMRTFKTSDLKVMIFYLTGNVTNMLFWMRCDITDQLGTLLS